MINQERLINDFMEMVRIDSLSYQEGKFAAYLKAKLQEMGLEVIEDQQAGRLAGSDTGNIIGRLPGKIKDAPPIFFSAHMDTVPLGEGIEPIIKDGVLYSSGDTVLASDDKAGVAAILEALRCLQEEEVEHGDVEVLFTVCEETGLLGARYLDYGLLQAKTGFVLDCAGSPGTIICQAPAHNRIDALIIGKAAHAGMQPENGVNAIQVAAKAINRMNLLRIDEETTANVGVIKGGEVTNVVCERVELQAEARSLSEEKLCKQTKHMVNCFQKVCDEMGALLEVKVTREYPAFTLKKEETVVQIAVEAAQSLGFQVHLTSSGGGSDTNYFCNNGLKVVNLGIGMSHAHTKEEFIKIEELVRTAHYVTEITRCAAQS